MQVLNVIVVEDDEELACLLTELLSRAGHRVTAVPTGEEAYRLAQQHKPNVIICDIGLSGEWDGYRFAQAIRSSPVTRLLRLVAVTGYGSAQDIERAKEAGFDVHLTKPVDMQTMLSALQAT